MSADLARSRDRAVHAMRTVAVVVLLFGLTLTGALAGVFARQNPPSGGTDAAGTGVEPAAVPTSGQPVLVVVHEPARTPGTAPGSAASGAVPAGDTAAEPAPAAPVAPAPAPTVAAPPAPVETAATSSGSDPG